MRIGLVSNHGQIGCGVAEFGRQFRVALHRAGHDVFLAQWDDPVLAVCQKVIVNFDSGTLPLDKPLPKGCTAFVHHGYRGIPEGLSSVKAILSPVRGLLSDSHYFPYPIPTPAADRPVQAKSVGVTTIRGEGVDYLTAAAGRRGWTVHLPDRWRGTAEEVERLAGYACVGLWYTDSPGRSLALATAIAAQRPILLSHHSRMFEYAEGSEELYWTPYTNQDVEIIAQGLDRIAADLKAGTERRPRELASRWSWPKAIKALEAVW